MNRFSQAALLALLFILVGCSGAASAQQAVTPPILSADAPLTPADLCAKSIPAANPATRQYGQAEQVLQAGIDYRAVFCTDAGAIYLDLYEDETPITVNNFVFLAQNNYYNNTTFHRVIQDFMAQGGDPTATGSGGPGYQFQDEFIGYLNFSTSGQLAMANAGAGTNGSQFFITTVPTPHLDYKHTIFGRVLEGFENVLNIKLRDPQTASAADTGTQLQAVVIITDPATIQTTYTPHEPATQADVEKGLGALAELITPDVEDMLEYSVTPASTQATTAALPEAAREPLSALWAAQGHQYRVTADLNNKACDLQNFLFLNTTYTLDAFSSREAATTVISDPAWAALPAQLGYVETQTNPDLPHPMYLLRKTLCETDVIQALTYWQRGRYIGTGTITIGAGNTQLVEQLPQLLSQLVAQRIFEAQLADVYTREIR